MAVDLGEAITRTINITNSAGVATDADSTPTYAVTLPDGSAGTPPAVNHGATGTYYVNFTTTVAGLHSDIWTATVLTLPLKFGPDSFVVRPAAPSPLLGLAEARSLLGLGSDATRDERLFEYVEAATVLCEDHTGRSFRRHVVVETYDGGRSVLVLHDGPVMSITSVTESGTAVTSTGWVLDSAAGLLWRGSITQPSSWASGVQNIVVTYVVGASTPSARTRQAVRVTLQHLWSTQGGASGGPRRNTGASVNDYGAQGGFGSTGWSLPRAAEELLAGDMAAGFA